MKGNNLINLFTSGNIVIPMYLLKKYKEINVSIDEFLFLMYLYNLGDKYLFNPNKFSEDLNFSLMDVLTYIDKLTDKGLIRVEVLKNDKNIMEEVIILEGLYNKLSLLVMDDVNDKKEVDTTNIFSVIEKEFGKSLTPFELEIIKGWLECGYSEELVIEAVKEAVFNHVNSLKYIDKILYDWSKNNIKTLKDVEENRKKRSERKENDVNVDLDIVDWNWFEDED